MTALSFDFKDCDGTAGIQLGAAIGAATFPQRNRHHPVTMFPAFGHCVVLNGIDLNQQMTHFGPGGTGTLRLRPLVEAAPFGTMIPAIEGLGLGRIRGDGYRWIFRYANSTTGEVTGFSEVDPGTFGTTLGQDLGGGGFLGQNAFFSIPSCAGDTGALDFDRIQVFRNTTKETAVFYMVADLEAAVGTTADGFGGIFFRDDRTDDDLINSGAETAGLVPNPSFAVGVPWPLAKGWVTPSSRVEYYGGIRMGPWQGSATVTRDSRIATVTVAVARERVGQRFSQVGGNTNDVYRICAINPGNLPAAYSGLSTVAIEPAWRGATGSISFEIEDDRDFRLVWPSEPFLPTQCDVTKQWGVGGDQTDPLLHRFAFRGRSFAVTRSHVFSVTGDELAAADVVVQCTVAADEGTAGLWSSALTPDGLVFVNERGVRLFRCVSGNILTAVDPPEPLGAGTPRGKFGPFTQFQGVDPDYLSEARVMYDPVRQRVYVAYCPVGGGGVEECLAWQYEDEAAGTPAVWRGPWRVALTCVMELRDDAGGGRVVYGDDSGNLLTADESAVDILDSSDGTLVSGTIDVTPPNPWTFSATVSGFDPSGDKRVVGAPIVFDPGGAAEASGVIEGFDGTYFLLRDIPAVAIVSGRTFKIGVVRWQATTAMLDAGEPIEPKKFARLRVRHTRGSSGCSTAKVGVSCDGGTSYVAEGDAAKATVNPYADGNLNAVATVYTDVRVMRSTEPGDATGGRAFQIQVGGVSVDGHPKITGVVADIEVHEGA